MTENETISGFHSILWTKTVSIQAAMRAVSSRKTIEARMKNDDGGWRAVRSTEAGRTNRKSFDNSSSTPKLTSSSTSFWQIFVVFSLLNIFLSLFLRSTEILFHYSLFFLYECISWAAQREFWNFICSSHSPESRVSWVFLQNSNSPKTQNYHTCGKFEIFELLQTSYEHQDEE